MSDFHEEIARQQLREENQYRRELAAGRARARRRNKLIILALAIVALAGIVALIVVLILPGDSEPVDRGKTSEASRKDKDEIEIPAWITQDLLPVNEYSRPGTPLEEVTAVVVHYVGNPSTTARQNRNYFANLAETHETSASSHFVVGLEGEIIQCVPLDEWAYCSSSANSYSIAIEVCHPDESGKFNEETVESLVKLLKWLCEEYDLGREDVIRHYDVTGKICPKYYVDNPDEWEALLDLVFPDGDGGEDEDEGEKDTSGGFLAGLLEGLG